MKKRTRPTSTNHLSHYKFVFAGRSQVIQVGEDAPSRSAGGERFFPCLLGGIPAIMAYTGRLRLKVVPFSDFRL